jgi:hypothetical protein
MYSVVISACLSLIKALTHCVQTATHCITHVFGNTARLMLHIMQAVIDAV